MLNETQATLLLYSYKTFVLLLYISFYFSFKFIIIDISQFDLSCSFFNFSKISQSNIELCVVFFFFFGFRSQNWSRSTHWYSIRNHIFKMASNSVSNGNRQNVQRKYTVFNIVNKTYIYINKYWINITKEIYIWCKQASKQASKQTNNRYIYIHSEWI